MSIQSEIDRIKNNVAAAYTAMEEQGATMPEEQNSDNMASTVLSIPKGTGGGTTVQSDWSENNSGKAAYVKGRTHWKEVYGVDGEVIAETSVSFTSNIKTITGAMSDAIKEGGEYTVTWNGEDYVCTGKESSDGNYIGNGSFMNAGNDTFEDTGEPFCILMFGGTYYMVYKADTTAETVTVKVVGRQVTVWHKLDKGYLDEALQFGSWVMEVLPETTVEIVDMEGMIASTVSLTEGETYTVKYNGVDYPCVCFVMEQDGAAYYVLGNLDAIMGTGDTGEPFIVMSIPDYGVVGVYALDGSESVALSISGEVVKKMDGKYLPEGMPYVETSVMDILPKTTLEVNPDVGTADFSDIVDVVVGNTYTVKYNGVEYTCTAQPYEQDGMTMAYSIGNLAAMGGDDSGEPFLVMCFTAEAAAMVGGGGGCIPLDGSETVTLSISGEVKVAHKMAAELLPEGTPYVEPFDDVIMAAWPSNIGSDGIFTDPAGTLVVGNVYKVNWGGTVYECVAKDADGSGASLGNTAAIGGIFTSDPFGIIILSPAMQAEYGFSGIIECDSPPENDEFSIIGGWKVQKINEHCLPDSTEPLVVKIYKEGNNVFSSDTTYAEVRAAISGKTPRMVYLADVNSSGVIGNGRGAYTFSCINNDHLYFQSIFVASLAGGIEISLKVIEWKNDNTISEIKSITLAT